VRVKARSELSPVETELLGESAHTLGLTAKRMQEALAALARLRHPSPERVRAVDRAAQAAHAYVIQRELLGFRDTEAALDMYQVPGEVRARLGARPRRA
jgi:hypothetical protein